MPDNEVDRTPKSYNLAASRLEGLIMPVVKEGSIGKVGRAIYNQEIRHKVESTEKGKVVVIDVTIGTMRSIVMTGPLHCG